MMMMIFQSPFRKKNLNLLPRRNAAKVHLPNRLYTSVKTVAHSVHKGEKPTAEDLKGKRVRGRRGLLSSLKEFPLDVLFEAS